ncbi:MAG: DUF4142 domain-containing protein [Chitinophagaceae bacterium]|nr:DUF4142 domain-containing protein [Chitinophagaceae bacterium]
MKRLRSFLLFFTAILFACNNDGSNTTTTTNDSANQPDQTATTTDTSNAANTNTTANATPLDKMDSAFVMKAAAGGMMEVEAGNIAQQNAESQRVKDFGAMMVRDHSQANDELRRLASSHGLTLPTELPADMRKHLDAMRKMTGKAFDKHYMSMMLSDHKKDVGEFEKASKMCKAEDCLGFAAKTLPVLRTHLDSAQAISKSKM